MKVYIVSKGEKNEGGDVEGVFDDFITAVNFGLNLDCCFDGGWERDLNEQHLWTNGCDYMKVEEWEVK